MAPCLSLFSKEVGWLYTGGQVSRQWGYPIQEKVKARVGAGVEQMRGGDPCGDPVWETGNPPVELSNSFLSLYGPLAFLPPGLFRLMDTLTGMSINQQPEISIIENLFKVKSQS